MARKPGSYDTAGMEQETLTEQDVAKLHSEVEAYLAFYAILSPLAEPPRVEVNARRMRRRIDQYGVRADILKEES